MTRKTRKCLESLFALIFRWSNQVLDISVEQPYDPENTGSVARFEVIIRMPLFWLRQNCHHEKAKKTGLVKNGKTYCLRCEKLITVDSK